jgi:TatD DNase family protein
VIDTHAHLDSCADPAETVIARARDAGVTRIVTVGSGLASCRAALALAEREPGIYCALGIHPHQAADGESVDELPGLLAHQRAVAVGETGLDFYRDRAPRRAQLEVFGAQLTIADEKQLPIVVHCRAAEREVASSLDAFPGTVVLHCFSSPELLPIALERDYYVSFAGNVTYPKADDLRAAASRVPPDRILAETDSPYLAPQPCRGQSNEPANVVHTVAALATVRGEPAAELAARIEENASIAFGLP